jgi:hypothetical protein
MPKYIDQDTGKEFPLFPTAEWLADRQRFDEEACKHPVKEVRSVVYSDGSVHCREQCQECGEYLGKSIPKAKAPANMPAADPGLRDRYQRERDERRDAIDQKHIRLQREDGNAFRKRHKAYLASRTWKTKREKVLRRADGVCEGCLEARATQVHHLNYLRWGDELLFDLVALCSTCHGKCHPEARNEEWQVELPCYGCRWQSWGQGEQMQCGKFETAVLTALANGGPCGPGAAELEPLK